MTALRKFDDNLNQPGFSAALLSMSDMAELHSHVYDMGKAPVAENLAPRPDLVVAGNSAGIKESWKNAYVVAARLTRDGVRCTVDGRSTESKSLRESFRLHGLPDARHIRFRMQLKTSRAESFVWEGVEYHFELIALG